MEKLPAELKAVRTASAQYESAEARWMEALYRARRAGHSLRSIAEHTGLSHETIRRLLK